MQVDRILYPIHTLGPGERLVIWVQGCRKRCPHCANPELRPFQTSKNISLDFYREFLEKLSDRPIDGFTITGGEPLCQADELLHWIQIMKEFAKDILLFTGYSKAEIEQLGSKAVACVKEASVVVAGEYVDEQNDNMTALLASANQEIIWSDTGLQKKYQAYMAQGRRIENVYYQDELMSVGIHNRRE